MVRPNETETKKKRNRPRPVAPSCDVGVAFVSFFLTRPPPPPGKTIARLPLSRAIPRVKPYPFGIRPRRARGSLSVVSDWLPARRGNDPRKVSHRADVVFSIFCFRFSIIFFGGWELTELCAHCAGAAAAATCRIVGAHRSASRRFLNAPPPPYVAMIGDGRQVK